MAKGDLLWQGLSARHSRHSVSTSAKPHINAVIAAPHPGRTQQGLQGWNLTMAGTLKGHLPWPSLSILACEVSVLRSGKSPSDKELHIYFLSLPGLTLSRNRIPSSFWAVFLSILWQGELLHWRIYFFPLEESLLWNLVLSVLAFF